MADTLNRLKNRPLSLCFDLYIRWGSLVSLPFILSLDLNSIKHLLIQHAHRLNAHHLGHNLTRLISIHILYLTLSVLKRRFTNILQLFLKSFPTNNLINALVAFPTLPFAIPIPILLHIVSTLALDLFLVTVSKLSIASFDSLEEEVSSHLL
jgi:hypothetical protein